MKNIKAFKDFVSEAINEATKYEAEATDLINAWINMDTTDPGNEEYNIKEFIWDGGREKDLRNAMKKQVRSMDKNAKDEFRVALDILLRQAKKHHVDENINETKELAWIDKGDSEEIRVTDNDGYVTIAQKDFGGKVIRLVVGYKQIPELVKALNKVK